MIGKMKLDFEPQQVKAVKSKSGSRVLLYNKVTDEFVIYHQDLKKKDKTVPIERAEGDDKNQNVVLDIM